MVIFRRERYADDMTISTRSRAFPSQIAILDDQEEGGLPNLSERFIDLIETNGFKINDNKTRMQRYNRRQSVTGLVVNRKVNINRRFIRQTRAMLHAWERYGLSGATQEYVEKYMPGNKPAFMPPVDFQGVVRGKIEFIQMVRGDGDDIVLRLKA